MLATVISASLLGIDGLLVRVEVDSARGLPHYSVVGLPDAAVCESRERILQAYPYLEPEDLDEALAYAAWRLEEREEPLVLG